MDARGPTSNDTASLRVPRGVRSLSGRLVLLLSLPLIAAQTMAYATLDDRHDTAVQARALAEEIDLVADIGMLFAPIALEKAASFGLAEVDRMGVDRDLVASVTGIDYETYVASARDELDASLDHLVEEFADLPTPSGRLLGDEVAEVRTELDLMRRSLDAGDVDPSQVAETTGLLDDLMVELLEVAGRIHTAAVASPQLGELADHVSHLLALAETLSRQALTTAEVLGASTPGRSADDVVLAAGAAELAVEQFRDQLHEGDEVRWAPVQETLDVYQSRSARLFEIARIRAAPREAGQPNMLLSDPDLIRELAEFMRTEFDNLRLVGEYTRDELHVYIDRAAAIERESGDEVKLWIAIIVLVTMLSIGFLILVAVSTARPLAKLTARALRLSEGVVDPRPLGLSGPSDVRAVTATFNTVT